MNRLRDILHDANRAEACAAVELREALKTLPPGSNLCSLLEKVAQLAESHALAWKNILDAVEARMGEVKS